MGACLVDAVAGALPQTHVLMCLLDIASAMAYLHSVGVLHGDLKSANVLLKSTATDLRGYVCKLADFGCGAVARCLLHARPCLPSAYEMDAAKCLRSAVQRVLPRKCCSTCPSAKVLFNVSFAKVL